MAEHTACDPLRARAAVLGVLVWLEEEVPLHGLSEAKLMDSCSSISHHSKDWNKRKFRRVPGGVGNVEIPVHEKRAHCIGRAQTRGERYPKYWFIVPPDIKPAEQAVIREALAG